jgi:hypothetical protein
MNKGLDCINSLLNTLIRLELTTEDDSCDLLVELAYYWKVV